MATYRNDYFIVSEDLFALIQLDCRFYIMERIESDHLLLELHTNVEEMQNLQHKLTIMNILLSLYGKLTVPSSLLNLCILMKPRNNCVSPRV